MTNYTFFLLAAIIAYILYKDIRHEARVEKLLNRFMARNYQEFNYFEKKYDKDIAVEEKVKDVQIKTVIEAAEEAKAKAEELEATEEDWGEEV